MDWLKLFALVVTVTSIQITAESPKKKIRIHLPEKVKHIHHHKKIYITNHPASSQYAPAFMPSAEGTVAVPTNVGAPPGRVVPIHSVELYNGSPQRLTGISPAASKLLPLYRARGYYGPTPTAWEEQEDYEVVPSAEAADGSYLQTAFTAPSAAPTAPSNYPPKRVKIVNLNEPPRKKPPRKNKPKRVALRNKPISEVEEEHPVTTFHEQFYSDVAGTGTIRKLKKPQRVEKIIDGDTEHIHTYSEEHIHKLVFDDGSKVPVVPGIESVGSMSALAAPQSLVPIKNSQTLIAIPPDTLTGFTAIGSMGTPSHLEYSGYNPREVTHDHIFHDHGEVPAGVDLSKGHLPYPTRTSYTSQGLRVNTKGTKGKHKYSNSRLKPSSIPHLSYFENMYTPYKKPRKPTYATSFENSNEASVDIYRPVVPTFKLKKKANVKTRNVVPALYFGPGKQVADYRLQQASAPIPNFVSSTVVHEYKPKHYPGETVGTVGLSKFNKDIYSYPSNNYELDPYAAPSNIYTSENYPLNYPNKKGKKKSVSTQNISFGGLDHQTTVDHLLDSGISATSLNIVVPTAFDSTYEQTGELETAPATTFTIRQSSPVHPYYSDMAVKALQSDDQLSIAEASNDNFQFVAAPSPSSPPEEPLLATVTTPSEEYYELKNSDTITTETTNYETKPKSKSVTNDDSEGQAVHIDTKSRYKILALLPKGVTHSSRESSGKLQYGDKI